MRRFRKMGLSGNRRRENVKMWARHAHISANIPWNTTTTTTTTTIIIIIIIITTTITTTITTEKH